MTLIYGHDAAVAEWVAARIPHVGVAGFGPCVAVGVVRNGALAAGVVWHDWQPAAGTIQASVAADTPRWATQRTLREVFAYPFRQLGARKVWASVPHTNTRAIRFNYGVGFRREAVLSEHVAPKVHAVIFAMKRGAWVRRYGG